MKLPEFYFRVRENGAFVYRVETDARSKRLELNQIAIAKLRNGDIKAQGDHVLTDEERKAIEEWITARNAQLTQRRLDDILRTVDHLNETAHWAQSQASDEELEAITDPLLLAMHDLRTLLVRKKGDRLVGRSGA
jgi:hypothetical protein